MAGTIDTVAVLAGGLATRMRPHTETVPKAMLDVAGEPFIAHQLRLFRREGLSKVVLCLGHLGEQVVEFVGDGSRFGLEVAHAFDGARLLGTGGALLKALPLLGDPFFVIYGDSYLDTAYQPIAAHFLAGESDGLMTVFRNEGRWEPSNIRFENGAIVTYSKTNRTAEMKHIDFGLGILRARALAPYRPGQALDLATIYADLIAEDRLDAFEVRERFHEIGSPAGLAETDAFIRQSSRDANSGGRPPGRP